MKWDFFNIIFNQISKALCTQYLCVLKHTFKSENATHLFHKKITYTFSIVTQNTLPLWFFTSFSLFIFIFFLLFQIWNRLLVFFPSKLVQKHSKLSYILKNSIHTCVVENVLSGGRRICKKDKGFFMLFLKQNRKKQKRISVFMFFFLILILIFTLT